MPFLLKLTSFVIFLYFLCYANQVHSKDIRITPGVDKYDNNKDPNALEYEVPKPYWGPDASYVLNHECFVGLSGTTEYKVCPFQNVTQKRSGSSRSVLLGVWNEWLIPESASASFQDPSISTTEITLVNSSYVQGARCGGPKNNYKSTIVEFKCINSSAIPDTDRDLVPIDEEAAEAEFAVLSIQDSNACNYYISFNFPLPCSLLHYTHTKHIDVPTADSELTVVLEIEDGAIAEDVNIPLHGTDTITSSSSNVANNSVEVDAIYEHVGNILGNMSAIGGIEAEVRTDADQFAGGGMSAAQYNQLMAEVGAANNFYVRF